MSDGSPAHLLGRALDAADGAIGEGLERAVAARHRRRLRRAGWSEALAEPPGAFSSAGAGPRPGNLVEVLVDGADALPRIAGAIRAARRSVHIAGWYFTPSFALTREPGDAGLVDLLASLGDASRCACSPGPGRRSRSSHPTAGASDRCARAFRGGGICGSRSIRTSARSTATTRSS